MFSIRTSSSAFGDGTRRTGVRELVEADLLAAGAHGWRPVFVNTSTSPPLTSCSAAALQRCTQSFGNCCSPAARLCIKVGRRSESVMLELVSVRDCVRDCCAPARTRRNVERTTSCVRRTRQQLLETAWRAADLARGRLALFRVPAAEHRVGGVQLVDLRNCVR